MQKQNTLNHINHFTSYNYKFIINVFSTLNYIMENLNLKDEFLNYYFCWIKDLIRKNHNSSYIDNFDHQNPSKNSSLISMLSHHITIESFTH
jgi:hypothetical protein